MTGILAYHDLDERMGAGITNVAPAAFCAHLDYLIGQGCSLVRLQDVLSSESPPNSICVTLDDAMERQISAALPQLNRRAIPATAFVVTSFVGRPALWDYAAGTRRHADWSLLREWVSLGMNIGSHSCSHRDLRKLPDSELEAELGSSRQLLEDRLGQPVDSIAYPFGRYDDRVLKAAAKSGYTLGVTTRPGLTLAPPLALPRVVVSRLDTPLALEQRLTDTLWGTLERSKQHVVRAWAGGTIRYQQIRGDYRKAQHRLQPEGSDSNDR